MVVTHDVYVFRRRVSPRIMSISGPRSAEFAAWKASWQTAIVTVVPLVSVTGKGPLRVKSNGWIGKSCPLHKDELLRYVPS